MLAVLGLMMPVQVSHQGYGLHVLGYRVVRVVQAYGLHVLRYRVLGLCWLSLC